MNDNPNPQPSAPPTPIAAPASAPPPPPVTPAQPVQPVIIERKSAGLAGFLSVFPGLGHLYLGLYPRAFAFGAAFIFGCAFASHGRAGEFFGPLIAFVWFFAIIDAVRQARAINRGQLAESGFAGAQQLKIPAGTGGLTFGVILLGLGALWLADQYLDLESLWDVMGTWGTPVAFMLLGLVLIVSHVRKVRRQNEANVGMPPKSQ